MIKKIKKLLTRINEWIIEKIREWLGVNEDVTEVDNKLTRYNRGITDAVNKVEDKVFNMSNSINNKLSDTNNRININRETLKNVVEISTDVTREDGHGHSWAMISVGGKVQQIRFVNLDKRNIMEIGQFLRQYEAGRHTIDSPHGRIFENELYYFKKDKEE